MRKAIFLLVIVAIGILLYLMLQKKGKVETYGNVTEVRGKITVSEIHYEIRYNNVGIHGEVHCTRCTVKDVINLIVIDLANKGIKTLPTYNETSLVCFMRKCGHWKVLFNGNEVEINDKISSGKVEIIWEEK